MKPFDEDGNITLTEAEVDNILHQFDQTDPNLQRQIVAGITVMLKEAKDLLASVMEEIDTEGYVSNKLRTDIEEFLK